MKSATNVHPDAGHGNGSVRTQYQPAWSPASVVVPELLVLEQLLVEPRSRRRLVDVTGHDVDAGLAARRTETPEAGTRGLGFDRP